MKSYLILVHFILVALCLGGCIGSYNVQIIKVHEMIQDMEAIELDEPERASELPETGIHHSGEDEREEGSDHYGPAGRVRYDGVDPRELSLQDRR